MFLRAWPVSAVQLKWSAKVKGVIARCRRSVSETMSDGKQRKTSGGVKKTGEVWVGSLFLSLSRSKKKEGGRGGLVKTRLN